MVKDARTDTTSGELRSVAVATIGKAHGLKGEVVLILRTDQPEERLDRGTVLAVEHDSSSASGPLGAVPALTVGTTRVQQGRWYVRFDEVTDRTAAEALRGAVLTLDVDPAAESEDDPDAWYPDELKGLRVQDTHGRELGTVIDLEHYPAQDLLIVRTPDRRRVMLPFVEELVPEVDTEAGIVVADPPGGLFDELDADESDAAAERPTSGA